MNHDGWYWASTTRATGAFQITNGRVSDAPPIWRTFLGQPASNLTRWLRRQPGFRGGHLR
jgi:hypothetical protein